MDPITTPVLYILLKPAYDPYISIATLLSSLVSSSFSSKVRWVSRLSKTVQAWKVRFNFTDQKMTAKPNLKSVQMAMTILTTTSPRLTNPDSDIECFISRNDNSSDCCVSGEDLLIQIYNFTNDILVAYRYHNLSLNNIPFNCECFQTSWFIPTYSSLKDLRFTPIVIHNEWLDIAQFESFECLLK